MLADLKICTKLVTTSYLCFMLGTTTSADKAEVQCYAEDSIKRPSLVAFLSDVVDISGSEVNMK